MVTKKKVTRKMGRPPAPWVFELASSTEDGSKYLDYHALSNKFGITLRAVHIFCTKAGVEGEYYKTESRTVRKRFTVDQLRTAARKYLEQRTLA
jgi:hypothetical protein